MNDPPKMVDRSTDPERFRELSESGFVDLDDMSYIDAYPFIDGLNRVCYKTTKTDDPDVKTDR